MAKVQHTCTGCVPIDASIIEAYVALVNTNEGAKAAEAGRVLAEEAREVAEAGRVAEFEQNEAERAATFAASEASRAETFTENETERAENETARVAAEASRVSAEAERVSVASADHETAASDHTTATSDHGVASSDHSTAVSDHGTATEDHTASTTATTRANEAAAAAEHQVDVQRGYGIDSVTQVVRSTANGGDNTIRVTTEDGKTFDFYVKNGKSSAGFFATAAALSAAISSPNVGDYAFVSKAADGSFPAYIYVCATAGTWTATEEEYDGDNVDLAPYATVDDLSQLRHEVDEKLDGVEVTNPVWLWVITDKDGRVLGGVKADGSIEWAIGIPKPIKDELDSLTLTVAGKVNKVVGKSLIDSIVADATISFDNPDYLYLMTDENGKIVIGIKKDGKLYADIAGIPADVQEEVDDLQGQINDITSGAEGEEKYFQLSEQSNNIIDAIGFSSFKEKTMTIISPDKYSCWPRIGKVGNKLVCAYVKALEHEDPHNGTGAIWVSTSANGIVWTPKRLIIDTENVRDGVTGCGNDENGNLLFINRVGYPGDANTYQEIYKTTNGIDFELISTIPASTPLGHIGDIINVPTKGLMAFFGEYGNDSAPWGYILSSDNGETWTKVVVESVVREQRPMEMSGVYLGNGKILVAGRYEGSGSAYMWQMQSEDYGETWTKQATNISGNSYTPSLVFDQLLNKISLYIYNRGTGQLEYRQVSIEDVWDNPTGWPTATIISTGAIGQDAGNVSAVAFKGSQFAAFYSGNSTDTGIYSTIN